MRYNRSIKELEELIEKEFSIKEIKEINNGFQIKTSNGGVINWYKRTGTILLQGKKVEKDLINSYLFSCFGNSSRIYS